MGETLSVIALTAQRIALAAVNSASPDPCEAAAF